MDILRRGVKVAAAGFTEDSAVKREIGGVDELDATFTAPCPLDIRRGDYVIVDGLTFVFDTLPTIEKASGGEYKHTATMKGEGCVLARYLLMFLDEDATKERIFCTASTFDLTATLAEFLELLCRNVNRNVSQKWGYKVGDGIDNAQTYDLTFDGVDCQSALESVCEQAEAEWLISGRTIYVAKRIERKTGVRLSYPENLTSPIEISHGDTDNTCTRLFVFGGERNIPKGYNDGKSTRLLMSGRAEFIEKAGSGYTIEKTKTFDDVYPRCRGKVTGVSWSGVKTADDGTESRFCYITDENMAHNMREWFNENTAKIAFTSGLLVGYEFEVAGYSFPERKIELKQQLDGDVIVPNGAMCPRVGDSYVWLDIDLPDFYINEAEQELTERARAFFKEYCGDNATAEVNVSAGWLMRNNRRFEPFQTVRLVDEALGVDKDIRVQSVTYYPFDTQTDGRKVTLKLADFQTKSLFSDTLSKLNKTAKNVYNNYKQFKKATNTTNLEVNSVGDVVDWNTDAF